MRRSWRELKLLQFSHWRSEILNLVIRDSGTLNSESLASTNFALSLQLSDTTEEIFTQMVTNREKL